MFCCLKRLQSLIIPLFREKFAIGCVGVIFLGIAIEAMLCLRRCKKLEITWNCSPYGPRLNENKKVMEIVLAWSGYFKVERFCEDCADYHVVEQSSFYLL